MNEQLADLSRRYWDTALAASPLSAGILGDHRFDDQVEDLSREREDELIAAFDGFVAEAEVIDPAELDLEDRLTRETLIVEVSGQADSLRSRSAEFAVDPMIGIHMDLVSFVPQLSPNDREQADAYVTKASKVGGMFDQAIERLRQGIANGRTPVRTLAEKSLGQLDAYLAAPVEQDPFLQIQPPPTMDEAAMRAWREAMTVQVEAVVRPAVARYREVVADEVLPAARSDDEAGVMHLPDGGEVYERAVRRFTSLELDPVAVHQSGLEDIAGLEDDYRELGERVLGTHDLEEIYARLRDDPALRFDTSAEVLAQAERAMARANEATPDWFGRRPQAPCVVREIPAVGAADAPLAYYLPPTTDGSRPGMFFVNTTEPGTRTRYESEALAFHEGVPGHHFQIALGQEIEGVPEFRRHALSTAFVEGWGLYTERLADEMGLYSGDLERLGILSFDSWRAGRLVVDTGIHVLGWSRAQAIDYLAANSPQARNNIVNEVDRYIGWPGQALAYKIGQREIFRYRGAAERTLGDDFDIKGFHDAVLGHGSLPLPALGVVVEDWVAAVQAP